MGVTGERDEKQYFESIKCLKARFTISGDRFASHPAPQSASVHQSDRWQATLTQVAYRFNRQYQGEARVEAMPIFSGVGCQRSLKLLLSGKLLNQKPALSRYWLWRQLLIYPWRDWQAFFYGQESALWHGMHSMPVVLSWTRSYLRVSVGPTS